MRKSILVTVPNMHWIHKTVVAVQMRLLMDKRHAVTMQMPSRKPYVNNLQHCVKEFKSGSYDYWLNIDADNPPTNNPLDLVELDKDLIGLPTPIWHYTGKKMERPIYLNAYDYVPEADAYKEHLPHEGLQKVDAIGTGCFLVARRIFDHPDLQGGVFHRTWNADDGTVDKGNDLAFCGRVRDAGFQIWCHYDYVCDHMSELDLLGVARAFGYTRPEVDSNV